MRQETKGRTGKAPDMTSSLPDDDMLNDPVLPSQFFNEPEVSRGQPEKRLMWAVLEDALKRFEDQFNKEGREVQRLAREAEEWLVSANIVWPFSFQNICAALGLDADYLRFGLRRWKEEQRTKEKGKNFSEGRVDEAIQRVRQGKVLGIAGIASKKQGRAA